MSSEASLLTQRSTRQLVDEEDEDNSSWLKPIILIFHPGRSDPYKMFGSESLKLCVSMKFVERHLGGRATQLTVHPLSTHVVFVTTHAYETDTLPSNIAATHFVGIPTTLHGPVMLITLEAFARFNRTRYVEESDISNGLTSKLAHRELLTRCIVE